MPAKCHFTIKSFQKKPAVIMPPRFHGLFGMSFKDHMMMDKKWTPDDLMSQYEEMTKVLYRFKKVLDANKSHCMKQTIRYVRQLRRDCRVGRKILYQKTNVNGNTIGQVFIERKELKRRYSNAPLEKINFNLDQQTFCLRKEHDRLKYRANKLKMKLKELLIKRANIENLINVQEQLQIPEFEKMAVILKELEKNKNCYWVSAEINCAYKKIIRTLNQEARSYGAILDSLQKDILDQDRFIEYILDLGKPAIARFAELKTEFNRLQNTYQEFMRQTWKKMHKVDQVVRTNPQISVGLEMESLRDRYDRKSHDLKEMEAELQALEDVIKELKVATYCANSLNIYPSIKNKNSLNEGFMKQVECMNVQSDVLNLKSKLAKSFKSVLNYNLSPFEEKRYSNIHEIQEKIRAEDTIEATLLHETKIKSYEFVIIRYFLWQMYDILKCVEPKSLSEPNNIKYKTAYLNLPLLRFDGDYHSENMKPLIIEENLEILIQEVIRKLKNLTITYNSLVAQKEQSIDLNVNSFRAQYLISISNSRERIEDLINPKSESKLNEVNPNVGYHFDDRRENIEAPYRKQIKAASYALVEENAKKDT